MAGHVDLDRIDIDGAIREAEAIVSGDTRAEFLRKGVIGGGALATAGVLGAALPAAADARHRPTDIAILQYALTLEYLEASFYDNAVSRGGLSGPVLELAKLLASHENTHVSALRRTIRTLRRNPVNQPKFDFGNTFEAPNFLATAFALENLGVRAYLGQVTNLRRKPLLRAASTIVTVEARHAAAVATLIDQTAYQPGAKSITPNGAFDRATGMKGVLSEVKKTGFIKS